MSEIKLNLVDSQRILCGTVHGSVADRAVAALTAEPETIDELILALDRYEKRDSDTPHFAAFHEQSEIDEKPWDAGLIIIDLPARLVASMSTYSHPHREGQVTYHDGECASEIRIPYRVSDDWHFVYAIEEYNYYRDKRTKTRAALPPLDTRRVLYGPPLLDFIAQNLLTNPNAFRRADTNHAGNYESERHSPSVTLHGKWLATPRADLRNQSPREVILARQDFIDFDMHTRELQWSFQHEGPPCLPLGSNAYRFAGFGTHEWVIYYDLVCHLIESAVLWLRGQDNTLQAASSGIELAGRLQRHMSSWLETPNDHYDKRTPTNLIEAERKRLPIAVTAKDMIVSDDCPMCRMMAEDMELGNDVGFWHLDGSHMAEGFVFSSFLTREEWEADRLRWRDFTENFEREQAEREAKEKALAATDRL